MDVKYCNCIGVFFICYMYFIFFISKGSLHLSIFRTNIRPGVLDVMETGPDAAVVMSSVNGLVGTGFTSHYRLQPIACF